MTVDETSATDRRDRAFRTMLRHVEKETTDEFGEIAPSEAVEYRDTELAALERDRVFGEVPFIVAHGSEIAKPNEFLTRRLPRNNAIVIRQRDGGVKAFVNACRHRGAQLVEEESGRCRLFSCPYHRWSYDPSGELRTVTLDDTFGDFDRSKHGLVELPVQERHGFLWMIDNAKREIDVESWLGPEMDAILAGYTIEDLVSVTPQTFDRPTNWKIMQDGFLDNYHVKYAHPNTAGKVLHTNKLALEDFGRHFWFLAARKSIDRFIGDEDPAGADIGRHTIESCFMAPNSMLLKHATHVELLTFRPYGADPENSVMEMRIMAPTTEALGMDQEKWDTLWAKNWKIMISIIHDEDFPILEGSQAAMRSQDAGTMLLGRNELGNHLFRRELDRLVRTEPDAG
ncbi:aromatic-ring-hydroxylating dioxygenase [Pseudonocardia sp. EC080610-09]|uniref:aromatic ring-hydroxylating oxygenase subunit alpha n=1 Tax=unclassified Pseudonocardia TaxID=2619320 RepID=UPI0006CB045F|nr:MULTISPECIES: aromatic ring-hydroxylating dioxygenase subunit alpha [unclassified Pseudonocardia]ALE74799.1 aromatic-ring-hydroxylating dioxygenase [Pseudonocardia sp. EC080625-04]ALL74131.1 aromatic-ring-hydroxylating dioxygenase [Pseudonocardia sp. EC080610-09]ALL81155.1 aromatic-ring-hydroxylating dioxygenase [Pseudonocardia sp. EC080619-01]